MSSNMYGCECFIEWQGRGVNLQLVIPYTYEDEPDSPDRIRELWESWDLIEVVKWELLNRDWTSTHSDPAKRIDIWAAYPLWKDDDPADISWSPPRPTDREILEIIATGKFEQEEWGWDT